MKKSIIITLILAFFAGIVGFSALFTVRQDQQALILQFGSPVRVEQEPGLKIKLPFIQNVEYYDRRILDLDPPAQEVILQDQKRVNVDAFARYKIIDPLEFKKKAQTDANFRQVFGNILNAAIRSEIGKILLTDMLSTKRARVMGRITSLMKNQADEFGIEVVDVRIGRTDLPDATSQAVFNRMKSDRIAQAAELRAKGEEQKLKIQAEADRDRIVILAEAQRKSQILRGEGDGARTTILNDAYGQDSEFFDFYRSLEAVGTALDGGTSMVLSPDSELLQFFDPLRGVGTPDAGN